jgi:hypothetical protein
MRLTDQSKLEKQCQNNVVLDIFVNTIRALALTLYGIASSVVNGHSVYAPDLMTIATAHSRYRVSRTTIHNMLNSNRLIRFAGVQSAKRSLSVSFASSRDITSIATGNVSTLSNPRLLMLLLG